MCEPCKTDCMTKALESTESELKAAILQIEEGKNKYSDLLQSHHSLCGQLAEAKEAWQNALKVQDERDELLRLIYEAKQAAYKAANLYLHGEDCPRGDDGCECDEKDCEICKNRPACECSTGELWKIFDILNRTPEVRPKDDAKDAAVVQEFLRLERARAADPFGRCRCCGDGCDCGCILTCPLHKEKANEKRNHEA